MTAEIEAPKMTSQEYFASPGLSFSGMKDLAISPLAYWFSNINPDRPADEPTAAMQFGSALHCAVLEPKEFDSRYCRALDLSEESRCLITADDLREWLKSKGQVKLGKKKIDLIEQVQALDPDWPIKDALEQIHVEENEGKIVLSVDDWDRVGGAALALRNEPSLKPILEEGEAEVVMSGIDLETGVRLKSKLDWVTPLFTLDIKTFAQQRGKSIDQCVADAIFYEGYYRQAWLYTHMRKLQPNRPGSLPPFLIAFVESEEPFEVRIKKLTPGNLYWDRAAVECKGFMRLYADYSNRYGVQPWRDRQHIEILHDEDMKQLAYA